MCQAYRDALALAYPTLTTSKAQAPTKNNFRFATTTTSNKGPYALAAQTGTLAGPWTVGSTTVKLADATNGVLIANDNGAGGLTGTGIDPTSTINDTAGTLSVKFNTAPATGSSVYVIQDPTNLLANGLLDTALGNGTQPTCAGYSGPPPPVWWALTFDANLTTACGSGTTIVSTNETAPDGFPMFCLAVKGTLSGVATLAPTALPAPAKVINAADQLRMTMDLRVGVGPGGTLAGLQDVNIQPKLTLVGTTGTIRTRDCTGGNHCIALTSIAATSAAAEPYSNLDLTAAPSFMLESGKLLEHIVTNQVDTTLNNGATISLWSDPIAFTGINNVANDWKACVSRVAVRNMP